MMIREFLGRVPAGVRFGSLERRVASVGLSTPRDLLGQSQQLQAMASRPFS